MLEVVAQAGLRDHFERLPYDQSWIYRASDGEVIVDTIWAMANQRAAGGHGLADPRTAGGAPGRGDASDPGRRADLVQVVCGTAGALRLGRCAQPDRCPSWKTRLGSSAAPYGRGRSTSERRACALRLAQPQRSDVIPESIWDRLGIQRLGGHPADAGLTTARARLLDARPWFHRSPGSI